MNITTEQGLWDKDSGLEFCNKGSELGLWDEGCGLWFWDNGRVRVFGMKVGF